MKKNYVIIAFVIGFTGLTSCLKDDMISDQKYGIINTNAYKIIELPSPLTDIRNVAVDIKTEPQVTNLATVHLAAENPAPEDIKVTLSIANSQQLIDEYNTADDDNDGELDHDPLTPLPVDQYTLPEGLEVTIPKGGKDAFLKINFLNSSLLDPSVVYAIGVEIASVDKQGYTISGNFQKEVIAISVKNTYDGIYSYKGYIVRNSVNGPDPALSGYFKDKEAILQTVNANTVWFNKPLWANGSGVGGIDGTNLTVDPATNKVTVTSSNATLMNDPNYDNRYDPATKTFYISFKWGTLPNTRATTDTLVFKKPR